MGVSKSLLNVEGPGECCCVLGKFSKVWDRGGGDKA